MKNKLILSKLLSGLDRQNLELALLLFNIPQKCNDHGGCRDVVVSLPKIEKQKAAFLVLLEMHFHLKVRSEDRAYMIMPVPFLIKKQAS